VVWTWTTSVHLKSKEDRKNKGKREEGREKFFVNAAIPTQTGKDQGSVP
jgi:hypothetical protein